MIRVAVTHASCDGRAPHQTTPQEQEELQMSSRFRRGLTAVVALGAILVAGASLYAQASRVKAKEAERAELAALDVGTCGGEEMCGSGGMCGGEGDGCAAEQLGLRGPGAEFGCGGDDCGEQNCDETGCTGTPCDNDCDGKDCAAVGCEKAAPAEEKCAACEEAGESGPCAECLAKGLDLSEEDQEAVAEALDAHKEAVAEAHDELLESLRDSLDEKKAEKVAEAFDAAR